MDKQRIDLIPTAELQWKIAFKVYEFLFSEHPNFRVSYDECNGIKIEAKVS